MGHGSARQALCLGALLIIGFFASAAEAQQRTVGLLQNDEGVSPGYTLFKRPSLDQAYLIDNNGSLVHSWVVSTGGVVYLLENGNLLEGTRRIVEYTWDGTVVWDYYYQTAHHDLVRLPNGNTLLITRETIPRDQVIAAGRDPALLDGNLRPLHIVEVAKTGLTTGTIVWEWRAWDHLIQEFDPSRANYGVVADHPELIDLNHAVSGASDWLHANGIDYSPDLDQIVVSLRNMNELWVIDHSTTTAEAASHVGGNGGKGGDLLYRWGNPRAYGRGGLDDQQSFGQHDTNWIDPGLPGEGNILLFNNGTGRQTGLYSSGDEIVPPVDGYSYTIGPGPATAYDPQAPLAVFTADPPTSMYSTFYSSAQRLPNGNTLMGAGNDGTFTEVTPDNLTVWKYVNPAITTGPLTQGDTIPAASGPGLDNKVFKCRRYPPDFPGLAGKDLTPVGTIELYVATANLTLQSTAGGSVTNPGEGTYPGGVGQLITIDAQAGACHVFAGWTIESGSANIADPGSAHATFTMESQDTTLSASFVCDTVCDPDDDGICADLDNCPSTPNPAQEDGDGDGVGDACDNCLGVTDPDQGDPDGDGDGNPCDADDDDDGILDDGDDSSSVGDNPCADGETLDCDDNCQYVHNPAQADADGGDGGDACDNCPNTSNPGQVDADGDGLGDLCDPCPVDVANDGDGDGVCESVDNCPEFANPGQQDSDGDGAGDACDVCPFDAGDDDDGDGVCAADDNCDLYYNPDQQDTDTDGVGDLCDNCPAVSNVAQDDADGDGVGSACDNCIDTPNPDQTNSDGDPFGDACDSDDDDDGILDDGDLSGVVGDNPCASGQQSDCDDNCQFVGNSDQADADGDGVGGACDNCSTNINPDQADSDGDGDGDVCDPDDDNDGVPDDGDLSGAIGDAPCAGGETLSCDDNCQYGDNPDQADVDHDGVGDACDNCPTDTNTVQADQDADGSGDACDNCPGDPNPGQADVDDDGAGDVCDNCPPASNPEQEDPDGDGDGNPCDSDDDNDGIPDDGNFSGSIGDAPCAGGETSNCDDNCQYAVNPDQADSDGDGVGEVCDNCPTSSNSSQSDADGDGTGDPCDPDDDNDGVLDDGDLSGSIGDGPCTAGAIMDCDDNCPLVYNPDQADGNANGVGSACDPRCELVIGQPGPPETDFATILEALNAQSGVSQDLIVRDGCVLRVEPGTYADPLLLDRFVTMVASDGDPANTIIDPGGAAVAVDVPDRTTNGQTRIRGFTIRGATDAVVSAESLVLEDCVIESDTGTAVYLGSGEHGLENVSIRGGSSGVALDQAGTLEVDRSSVSGVTGTAVHLSGTAVLMNALIVDNPAPAVGLLVESSGALQLLHSTVANNGTGLSSVSANVDIEHSIICGNTTDISGVACSVVRFSDVCGIDCGGSGGSDCTGAEGNLSVDPLFVSSETGDYRLPFASPAVDAGMAPECFTGTPCHDFEDKPRLLDADGDGSPRADMGAFELDHPSALVPEPEDVSNLAIRVITAGEYALDWAPESSSSEYHVYEGILSSQRVSYGLTCLATVSGPPYNIPATIPPPWEVFIYTVSGDDAVAEGTTGYGTCAERSNLFDPCP